MDKKSLLCPVCEAGELSPIVYSDTFQHNGAELQVDGLEGYSCQTCGADPVFEDQIRRNHRLIVDAKREADGLLTGGEIRDLRKRLGLTQKDASELFGGGASAFSKYERGDVVQSVAMDRFLRMVGDHPYLLDELRAKQAGIGIWGQSETLQVQLDGLPLMPAKVTAAASNADVWFGSEVMP